ncbi:MAG: GNAT family N-acetyltransferase [Alphaproteobacteria bacterium]|nr:GNAT family N-acetyltransferase [Alphaproteobacteria bacterium]
MQDQDLSAVYDLSCAVHADLPERELVLREKHALSPRSCWCLVEGVQIVGYALTHPWMRGAVPPLDQLLKALPREADCLYLHDIALMGQMRGRGALRAVFELILGFAAQSDLRCLALTSVHGSEAIWAHYGFVRQDDSTLSTALASYGPSACYMLRALPSADAARQNR